MDVIEKAKLARSASRELMVVKLEKRNKVLRAIAAAIKSNSSYILKENAKDVADAKEMSRKGLLEESLVERLELSSGKLETLITGIKEIAAMPDPINKTTYAMELDKGLDLYRVTCPIGVICVVFESRPDALVQIASLCLKSGNAVLLKGGSEARRSNEILISILKKAAKRFGFPNGWIEILKDRKEFDKALKLSEYIDLVVARGRGSLVKHVLSSTSIPVLGHTEGLCHIYVDKSADIRKALNICIDSKVNSPATCNSVKFILVDKKISERFIPELVKRYRTEGVRMRCCNRTMALLSKLMVKDDYITRATEKDWTTEFLDLTAGIKIVNDIDEAISWVNDHSSRHTDGIIAEDRRAAIKFTSMVDSASVMVNASTRLGDGYRYGFGAEMGISTSKTHARGPVGLEGLVIYKYILLGNGQTVTPYTRKDNRKEFTHKALKGKFPLK